MCCQFYIIKKILNKKICIDQVIILQMLIIVHSHIQLINNLSKFSTHFSTNLQNVSI